MRELCRGTGPINRMLFRDKDFSKAFNDSIQKTDFKIQCQAKMVMYI